MSQRAKKIVIDLVKLAVSAAIIAWLLHRVRSDNPDLFARLRDEPKEWRLWILAWAGLVISTVLTFVRWYFLVRALYLPFRLRDALRLGFIGYMFNLVSLGSVGGDLFKAFFIAKEQPKRRTEAVTTIIADRLIGLHAVFLVAVIPALLLSVPEGDAKINSARISVLIISAALTFAFVVLLFPGFDLTRIIERVERWPTVGGMLSRVFAATQVYRKRRMVVLACLVGTFFVHVLNVTCFYLIAVGLPDPAPSYAAHFIIVPLGLVSSAFPLPGGLGAFEVAMDFLYTIFGTEGTRAGQGLLVAIVYRMITILIMLVGVAFYFRRRKEVEKLIHEAEEFEEGKDEGVRG